MNLLAEYLVYSKTLENGIKVETWHNTVNGAVTDECLCPLSRVSYTETQTLSVMVSGVGSEDFGRCLGLEG